MNFKIGQINHITFAVYDLEKSIDFYQKIFGDCLVAKSDALAYFDVNGTWFALNKEANIPSHDRERTYTHIAFTLAKSDQLLLMKQLEASGIAYTRGRDRCIGEGSSLYVRDLDGHLIEFHDKSLHDRLSYYEMNREDIKVSDNNSIIDGGINMKKQEIIQVLKAYQEGYAKRDIQAIDAFAETFFIDSEDTMIIGTGGEEWCKGIELVKELLYIDWFYWGNFQLNFDNMLIKVFDNVATVSTTAMLQKTYDSGKLCEMNLNRIKTILDGEGTNTEKVYRSLKSMAYFLHEEHVGRDVKRLIRFSGVLHKIEDQWKFSDIHFSYPVGPPTDIKLVD